jgi:hypothetical protein
MFGAAAEQRAAAFHFVGLLLLPLLLCKQHPSVSQFILRAPCARY